MCGNEKSVVEIAAEGALKSFGQMERMSKERMTKDIWQKWREQGKGGDQIVD